MRAFVFLGVCLAGTGVTALRFETASARDAGWLFVGVLSVAATVVGARMSGVWDRAAWRLVAGGLGLLTAGAGADLASRMLDLGWSYPSPVDALSIAGCGTTGLGVLLALRLQDAGRARIVAIDSVVATGAAATIAWTLLVEPHLGQVKSAPLIAAAAGTTFIALLLVSLAAVAWSTSSGWPQSRCVQLPLCTRPWPRSAARSADTVPSFRAPGSRASSRWRSCRLR
jgi:hypothetical protein